MATIDDLSAYTSDDTVCTDLLFEDVRKLLWQTCYEFSGKYGGDVEEYFAIASLRFCEIVKQFDAAKASFSYWLRRKVRFHLIDHVKREMHRQRLLPRVSNEGLEGYSRSSCSFRTFKAELSNDAQCVLNLLANGRCDNVSAVVSQIKNYNLPSASQRIKKAIETELTGTWEWSRERVRSAFVEISCALE